MKIHPLNLGGGSEKKNHCKTRGFGADPPRPPPPPNLGEDSLHLLNLGGGGSGLTGFSRPHPPAMQLRTVTFCIDGEEIAGAKMHTRGHVSRLLWLDLFENPCGALRPTESQIRWPRAVAL